MRGLQIPSNLLNLGDVGRKKEMDKSFQMSTLGLGSVGRGYQGVSPGCILNIPLPNPNQLLPCQLLDLINLRT